jgi:molybdenum cofactor guanylyltransferase
MSFVEGVSGVILAGGKSSRFGSNKAFAEISGARLIERVISVMGSVFNELIIITNSLEDYSYLGLPMYEDIIKGVGPLGGIYTGLEKISCGSGFFAPCDMPFLNESLIRYMAELKNEFDAVVPMPVGEMEPLHAVYSKGCLPKIRALIESKELAVNKLCQSIGARFLTETEIRPHDPFLRSFLNINRIRELSDAIDLESKFRKESNPDQ